MVAVNETVVCREGDVNHTSPVALHIFAATTKWELQPRKMFPRWE